MVSYNLSHLTQATRQSVLGPIQDDEALFLYSIIRGMRLQRILEIGGLSGYSARNFLAAVEHVEGTVITVDINPVQVINNRHKVIIKDARNILLSDLDGQSIDLIFFDCHDFDCQMEIYHKFVSHGIITDKTVLALHDTNLHPYKVIPSAYKVDGGWVHQPAERRMVNEFVSKHNYHPFCLHTSPEKHGPHMPYRHGITVLQKFKPLDT